MMRLVFILTTSPQHHNSTTVIRMAEAALENRHAVDLFLMDDGIYALKKGKHMPVSRELERLADEGLQLTLCTRSTAHRGIEQDDLIEHVKVGSLFDLSRMAGRADHVLCFGA